MNFQQDHNKTDQNQQTLFEIMSQANQRENVKIPKIDSESLRQCVLCSDYEQSPGAEDFLACGCRDCHEGCHIKCFRKSELLNFLVFSSQSTEIRIVVRDHQCTYGKIQTFEEIAPLFLSGMSNLQSPEDKSQEQSLNQEIRKQNEVHQQKEINPIIGQKVLRTTQLNITELGDMLVVEEIEQPGGNGLAHQSHASWDQNLSVNQTNLKREKPIFSKSAQQSNLRRKRGRPQKDDISQSPPQMSEQVIISLQQNRRSSRRDRSGYGISLFEKDDRDLTRIPPQAMSSVSSQNLEHLRQICQEEEQIVQLERKTQEKFYDKVFNRLLKDEIDNEIIHDENESASDINQRKCAEDDRVHQISPSVDIEEEQNREALCQCQHNIQKSINLIQKQIGDKDKKSQIISNQLQKSRIQGIERKVFETVIQQNSSIYSQAAAESFFMKQDKLQDYKLFWRFVDQVYYQPLNAQSLEIFLPETTEKFSEENKKKQDLGQKNNSADPQRTSLSNHNSGTQNANQKQNMKLINHPQAGHLVNYINECGGVDQFQLSNYSNIYLEEPLPFKCKGYLNVLFTASLQQDKLGGALALYQVDKQMYSKTRDSNSEISNPFITKKFQAIPCNDNTLLRQNINQSILRDQYKQKRSYFEKNQLDYNDLWLLNQMNKPANVNNSNGLNFNFNYNTNNNNNNININNNNYHYGNNQNPTDNNGALAFNFDGEEEPQIRKKQYMNPYSMHAEDRIVLDQVIYLDNNSYQLVQEHQRIIAQFSEKQRELHNQIQAFEQHQQFMNKGEQEPEEYQIQTPEELNAQWHSLKKYIEELLVQQLVPIQNISLPENFSLTNVNVVSFSDENNQIGITSIPDIFQQNNPIRNRESQQTISLFSNDPASSEQTDFKNQNNYSQFSNILNSKPQIKQNQQNQSIATFSAPVKIEDEQMNENLDHNIVHNTISNENDDNNNKNHHNNNNNIFNSNNNNQIEDEILQFKIEDGELEIESIQISEQQKGANNYVNLSAIQGIDHYISDIGEYNHNNEHLIDNFQYKSNSNRNRSEPDNQNIDQEIIHSEQIAVNSNIIQKEQDDYNKQEINNINGSYPESKFENDNIKIKFEENDQIQSQYNEQQQISISNQNQQEDIQLPQRRLKKIIKDQIESGTNSNEQDQYSSYEHNDKQDKVQIKQEFKSKLRVRGLVKENLQEVEFARLYQDSQQNSRDAKRRKQEDKSQKALDQSKICDAENSNTKKEEGCATGPTSSSVGNVGATEVEQNSEENKEIILQEKVEEKIAEIEKYPKSIYAFKPNQIEQYWKLRWAWQNDEISGINNNLFSFHESQGHPVQAKVDLKRHLQIYKRKGLSFHDELVEIEKDQIIKESLHKLEQVGLEEQEKAIYIKDDPNQIDEFELEIQLLESFLKNNLTEFEAIQQQTLDQILAEDRDIQGLIFDSTHLESVCRWKTIVRYICTGTRNKEDYDTYTYFLVQKEGQGQEARLGLQDRNRVVFPQADKNNLRKKSLDKIPATGALENEKPDQTEQFESEQKKCEIEEDVSEGVDALIKQNNLNYVNENPINKTNEANLILNENEQLKEKNILQEEFEEEGEGELEENESENDLIEANKAKIQNFGVLLQCGEKQDYTEKRFQNEEVIIASEKSPQKIQEEKEELYLSNQNTLKSNDLMIEAGDDDSDTYKKDQNQQQREKEAKVLISTRFKLEQPESPSAAVKLINTSQLKTRASYQAASPQSLTLTQDLKKKLNSKQKKRTQRQNLDIDCQVCFCNQYTDINPVVYCSQCDSSFHQYCYGIKNIPNGPLLCDTCLHQQRTQVEKQGPTNSSFLSSQSSAHGQNSNNQYYGSSNSFTSFLNNHNHNYHHHHQQSHSIYYCRLCSENTLPLQEMAPDILFHPFCLYINNLAIVRYGKIEFRQQIDISSVEELLQRESVLNSKPCHICNASNGIKKKCSDQQCDLFFHPLCVYLHGLELNLEENENASTDNFIFSEGYNLINIGVRCENHLQSKKVDILRQIYFRRFAINYSNICQYPSFQQFKDSMDDKSKNFNQ